jgi:4-amino-4-deoxy-L-arabinose transferase-like glycosyltransferase
MRNKENFFTALSIILIFSFIFFIGILWLQKDAHQLLVDESVHLSISIVLFAHLKNFSLKTLPYLLKISSYYPPFFHLTTNLFYFILGTSRKIAILTNFFYLFLTLIFIFLLAREVYNKKVALLSVFLFTFYPVITYLTKFYFVDLGLTFFVVSSLYFLIKTKNFSSFKYSILLGIFSALGMLCKWTFIVFIFLPIVYVFFKGKRTNLKFNFLSFIFTFFIISSIWYLPNFFSLLKNLPSGNILGLKTGDPMPLSFFFYTYYIYKLKEQMSIFFLILFFISLFFILKRKRNQYENTFLIHLFSSYIFLTIIFNKDVRFSVPFLPVVSILSASIFTIPFKFKKALLFIIFIFSFYNFSKVNLLTSPPKQEKIKLKEISKYLTFYTKKLVFLKKVKKPLKLGVYSESDSFSIYSLKYYLLKDF